MLLHSPGAVALEYESDWYVPTWEQKQGTIGRGFHRKKGVIGCGIQKKKKMAFLGVNVPKYGVIRCKFCQIRVKIRLFQLKIDKIFEIRAKRAKKLWF